LRRSNALRIKSNNIELLPYPLKESLMALRQSQARAVDEDRVGDSGQGGDSNGDEQTSELCLFDQIRRGVRLRPVESVARRRAGADRRTSMGDGDDCDERRATADDAADNATLSAILFRVLRQRYLAVQQTDDDDSELSSIESYGDGESHMLHSSDKLFLVDHRRAAGKRANCCVLYGPLEGQGCGGLLEQFAGLKLGNELGATPGLINDLIVRL
jgi:hypothetical protein